MNGKLCCLIVIATALSCKKPYNPPVPTIATGYLVVEGVINSGPDSTFIKLSRTVSIQTKNSINPELHAAVSVQGDQGFSYALTEAGNGNYVCAGLNLDNTHSYRLSIKTANNDQYLSDYAAVLNSPPIDSVSYDANGTVHSPGVNVYVNTHDPANKVVYYRWDYTEAWEIQSAFDSKYKSTGDTVVQRDLIHDDIHSCYLGDTSSTIILGSTTALSRNVIANAPIVSITSTDEKIYVEYSILVKQYALNADAYNFYNNLKKVTEELGSIFSAEPSQLDGNIHSVVNPAEPVIGYVCVGSIASQRIFIKKEQVPVSWAPIPYYANCALFTDFKNMKNCCYYSAELYPGYDVNQVNLYINYDSNIFASSVISQPVIPVDSIKLPSDRIIGDLLGFTAAMPECVDCTLRATNKRPPFWK